VLGLVGNAGVIRLAEKAGMENFRLVTPIWGLSQITPGDQAYYFHRIDPPGRADHARRKRISLCITTRFNPDHAYG
jgi:hypothetical protein